MMMRLMLATAVLLGGLTGAAAELRMPGVFGAGMVLQADRPAPVWGWAAPGDAVTVEIAGQRRAAVAGPDGRWQVQLEPRQAGGPHVLTVSGGGRTVTLEDVLFGQIWLNSGQSNMIWPLRASRDAQQEIAAATYPRIRLFTVTDQVSYEPLDDVKGKWQVCSPETAAAFSGVAYFFGRALHQALDQPVGLIVASAGNTRINVWTPHEAVADDPDYDVLAARDRAQRMLYEAMAAACRRDREAWTQWKAAAAAAGDSEPVPPPGPPASPVANNDALGARYYGMIHGLGPLALAGVTWYQGESNVDRAVQYQRLLPAMIAHWRARFAHPRMPFLIVQLANMHGPVAKPRNSIWAELRAAQAMTAANDPDVGLAVAIDIGDPTNIHPANKQDVGDRLARLALRQVYGRDIAASGPVFKKMQVDGNAIRIWFDHAEGGLVTRDGKPPRGFTIAAGEDAFQWAEAVIDGESVVLSSPAVPAPVAVRYAWAEDPEVNLSNRAGLPAAPFRTDNWLFSTRYNH